MKIPDTRESLIDWFTEEYSDSIFHDDEYKDMDTRYTYERGIYYTHERDPLTKIVDDALRRNPNLCIKTLHAEIVKYKFLYRGLSTGWITRYSEFYSCRDGHHTELLSLLGKDEADIRQQGWIKVTQKDYYTDLRPTRAQYVRLAMLGKAPHDRDKHLAEL